MTDQIEMYFRVLLLGETDVGKTSLRRKFISDLFFENKIGEQYINSIKEIEKENTSIEFEIVEPIEVSSNEEYSTELDALIIVYDLELKNFESIKKQITIANYYNKHQYLKILVGNKLDKKSEFTEEDYELLSAIKQDWNIDFYYEVSCKSGEGITEMFDQIVNYLYKHELQNPKSFEHKKPKSCMIC